MDAHAVRQWADASLRDLRILRADIDGINVYPVADSDTGTNLLHTMTAACDALARAGRVGAGEALTTLADAAVRAAKGNSGIILSQVLRGMARSAGSAHSIDGPALAAALRVADTAATAAVSRPVAGTMLSVLHAVATALAELPAEIPAPAPADVATLAATTAAEALARTPRQLAPLARAGVVDAGGRGLLAVLEALAEVVAGMPTSASARSGGPDPEDEHIPSPRAWEVMYLLTVPRPGTADALPALRRALSALGDSVTVAEAGEYEYAVHVHCADIGAALEAGLEAGRPHHVRVEPLITPRPVVPAGSGANRAVVAIVHGDAVASLVDAEGTPVLVVETGAEPSIDELLTLITGTAATHVTILPASVRLTAAAERASRHPLLDDRDVVVIPCASPTQVLAALAVHDPHRRAGADVVAMAEAAAATRRGEVVLAAEDAITWVGRVEEGDLVGFLDGEVVLIEPRGAPGGVVRTALGVLDRMLAVGGELVTVLIGDDAPEDIADVLAAHLRAERPEVELVCYPGGQADAVLLMGVE